MAGEELQTHSDVPLKALGASFERTRLLTGFHKLFLASQNPLWKNYCFPNGAANPVSSHAYQTLRILDTGFPSMNLHHWENCSYNLQRSQFVLLSLKFSGHLEIGADTATCFQCCLLLPHSVIHFTANLGVRGSWSEKLKDLPCLGILSPQPPLLPLTVMMLQQLRSCR